MVEINIQKSPIPIVWLDTSVIINMTKYKAHPDKLEPIQRERIGSLYKHVKDASRKGLVICPLADQSQEVYGDREEWFDTIHDLALGITCVPLKSIMDKQLYAAMSAFNSGSTCIDLSYKDVFHEDPCVELIRILQQPFFVSSTCGLLFGEEHQKRKSKTILNNLNQQRIRNVNSGIQFKAQLQKELLGDLEAMVIQCRQMEKGEFEDENDDMNAFFGRGELLMQLDNWGVISGKKDDFAGFLSFYHSEYNHECPYTNLSANLFAKIMIDPQPIRSGDPKDIEHISSLMAFSDLFITDKAWSTFLNREGFGEKYRTTVAYVGDAELIEGFFTALPDANPDIYVVT